MFYENLAMGLLDFDDKEILKGIVPADRPAWERRKFQNNFEDLQQLDRNENSADFADSRFADRRENAVEGCCDKCKEEGEHDVWRGHVLVAVPYLICKDEECSCHPL